MDRSVMLNRVEQIQGRIQMYQQMLAYIPCPVQRKYYEQLVSYEVEQLIMITQQCLLRQEINHPNLQEFTLEELAQYNGAQGQPAYVAVNGIVYDMSREATWGGGTHFGLYAGKDLTNQFAGCHGQSGILAKLPQVGILISRSECDE